MHSSVLYFDFLKLKCSFTVNGILHILKHQVMLSPNVPSKLVVQNIEPMCVYDVYFLHVTVHMTTEMGK